VDLDEVRKDVMLTSAARAKARRQQEEEEREKEKERARRKAAEIEERINAAEAEKAAKIKAKEAEEAAQAQVSNTKSYSPSTHFRLITTLSTLMLTLRFRMSWISSRAR
jgi:sRNA-binding protein